MRLSAIRLSGFKSFVDPTQLKLDSNLTAVVGPNGCGKSNIIDAVRWVMGESSARQLRGDAMEDVIFNGSKGRKPVGRAAVELVFDNSAGRLEGQFNQYAEISVKRELARDGASTYYLNGKRCRRRDVADLFLGTGLGSRNSYAIIQQGTVSRMVEARPEDMRAIIEEAAGISRYKERRRETENRIRHTRDNLDRLDDLRGELTERLATLKRQADNAERYKTLKAEERQLAAELVVLRLAELDGEARTMDARISEARQALEAAQAEADEAHRAADAARADQQTAGEGLQAAQGAFYGAESALTQLDQAIAHAKEMAELRRREHAQLAGEVDRLANEHKTAGEQRESLETALTEARHALEEATRHEDATATRAGEAESELTRIQSGWDQVVEQSQRPLREAERERARVESAERRLEDLAQRIDKLSASRAQIDLDAAQQRAQAAKTAHESAAAALAEQREQVNQHDANQEQARRRRGEVETALEDARTALNNLRGRLTSMEALQKAALQADGERIGDWLAQHDLADAPRLAELLTVESGFETAVEAVLGPWLQAVVAPALFDETDAPPAAVAVVSRAAQPSQVAPPPVAGAQPLVARVAGPAAVVGLLHGAYVTEDAAGARARAEHLKPGQRLVTHDGSLYGPGTMHLTGGDETGESVIARERALTVLRDEVAQAQRAFAEREQEMTSARQTLSELDAQRTDLVAEADRLARAAADALATREREQSAASHAETTLAASAQELDELTTARDEANAQLRDARTQLETLMQQAADAEARRKALQAELTTARQQMAEVRHALEQARRARQDAAMAASERETRLGATRQRVEELAARRRELDARLRAENARADRDDTPIETLQADRGPAEAHKREAEAALRQARERLQTAESRVRERTEAARKIASRVEPRREAFQQAKLDASELRVRRQTLVERLAEMNVQMATVKAGLADDATVADWTERLAAVERRIQRLGAINLAAIEEYAEQKERADYLEAQHTDLTGALEQLTTAINQIDRETRSRFRETFETVNGHFRSRFPILFGGGEANLELTGDDLLETGIRVMARPPGKRNASIQMLSGGEKAMTAVALLFALFQLTPAPFCMLDEVDAPLDDANVSRYCEMIRHMSDDVQFIIITHNKLTMELADQLHGVTMAEPGVSRMVSVDMEQALEMAG